jgi:hypothetical protein
MVPVVARAVLQEVAAAGDRLAELGHEGAVGLVPARVIDGALAARPAERGDAVDRLTVRVAVVAAEAAGDSAEVVERPAEVVAVDGDGGAFLGRVVGDGDHVAAVAGVRGRDARLRRRRGEIDDHRVIAVGDVVADAGREHVGCRRR